MGNLAICHLLNEMGVLNPSSYKKIRLKQNYQNANQREGEHFWSPSTIRNILKNDIYIGNMTQGKRKVKSYKIHKIEQVPEEKWIRAQNTHEPIVSEEIFQKAQRLNNMDTRVQKDGKRTIWSGLLKCGDCKRAMHKKVCKNKVGTIYTYYICGTYRKKSNQLCTKHTIKEEELEEAVLTALQKEIHLCQEIDSIFQNLKRNWKEKKQTEIFEEIKRKKIRQMEKVNHWKQSLYEDWKNGDLTKEEYLTYKEKYQTEIEQIKKSLQYMEKQKQNEKEGKEKENEWFTSFRKKKNIDELDRIILEEMIDFIEIYEDKKIKIHFCFQKSDEKRKVEKR